MNSINASVASVIAAAQAAQAGAGGGGSNNNNNPSSSLLTTMMPSSSNATTTTSVSRSNNGISSGNPSSSSSAVAAGSSSASTTTTSAISQHLKQQQQQQKQQHSSSNPQQQQQQTQLQQIQQQIREQQQHLLLQQELQKKNQQGNQQTHQNQQQNQQQQQQILPQNLQQQIQQQIMMEQQQKLQQELLQKSQQGNQESSSLQQEIQKQLREQQQKLLQQQQKNQGGGTTQSMIQSPPSLQQNQNQQQQQQQQNQQLQMQEILQNQLRMEHQQKLQEQQQQQPSTNQQQLQKLQQQLLSSSQNQNHQIAKQQQQQVVPSSLQSSINNHLFPIHGHTGLFVNQNVLMQQQNFLSNLLAANTVSSGLTNERLMGLTLEERNLALQELHGIQNLQQQQQQQQKQEDRCTINSEYMKTKIQETLQFANLMVLQEQQKQHQSLDSSSSSGNKNNAASNNNGSHENADTNTTGAYITALQRSPEYVRQLTWLCLRADNYDPSKSAQRLVSFFTFKKRLFGNSLLTKDIKLDDLEADDLDALKDGRVTLLPKKDSAKRSIIVCMAGLAASGVKVSVETWCRLFYYVTMCSVKDELPHENSPGSVFIMYAVGQKEFLSDRPGKLANIWWLLPVRLQATHVCYDRDVMSLFVRLMSQEMESRHLCRFRSHFGSWLECRHSLMTFGIPKDAWFIQDDGTVDLTKHLEWIQEQHSKEQGLATYEESHHKQKSEPYKEDSQKKLAAAASALTTTARNDKDGDNNDDSADHTRKKQKTNHTTNGGFSSSSTISPPTTLLSPSFINAAAAAGVGIINGNGINADSSMLSNLTTTNLKPNGKIHPTATTTKLKSTPTQASSHQSNGNTNGVLKSPKSVKKSPATPAAAANNNNGKPPTFVQPQPMDIVMGRGRHPSTSIGHMRLQSMVEERCEEYDRATKFEKTIIANLVVSELQQMGCRFIKQQQQQPGGDKSAQATFVLIEGDEIARDKVSHAFRNLRKKKAGMKK